MRRNGGGGGQGDALSPHNCVGGQNSLCISKSFLRSLGVFEFGLKLSESRLIVQIIILFNFCQSGGCYQFQAFPIIHIFYPLFKRVPIFSNLLSLFAFCPEIPSGQYRASTKKNPHSLEVKCYFVFWFYFVIPLSFLH